MKKIAVISAVNFTDGGPLRILQQCLETVVNELDESWDIYAIVHSRKLVHHPRVKCVEYPNAKGKWWYRIYLEWFKFLELSKELKPDIWFSLHDITSNVQASRRFVYCHNPAPFFRIGFFEVWFDPIFSLYSVLYGFLYGLNISKNSAVIVQQDWLRCEFQNRYKIKSIIVAKPIAGVVNSAVGNFHIGGGKVVLLYPALPRVFKNFEILGDAMAELVKQNVRNVELQITIDGCENRYSRWLYKKYSQIPGVKFIGRQNHAQLEQLYQQCDIVVFPSKIETWGLPITEAKGFGKILLVADQPYARETVGDYKHVCFLPIKCHRKWTDAILDVVHGRMIFPGNNETTIEEPFASNWKTLWKILTNKI